MKKLKSVLIASSTLLLLAACGTEPVDEADTLDDPIENAEDAVDDLEDEVDEAAEDTDKEGQEFTLEELSEYDGKDGNPAYVAIDGVVYDLMEVEEWSAGEHAEDLKAGNDYTSEIMKADHGDSVLNDLSVVGHLSE